MLFCGSFTKLLSSMQYTFIETYYERGTILSVEIKPQTNAARFLVFGSSSAMGETQTINRSIHKLINSDKFHKENKSG